MKVVINSSDNMFFSLSAEALKELALRNANCFTVLTPQIYYGGYKYPCKEGWEEVFEKDMANFTDIGDGILINSIGVMLKDGLLYMLDGHNDYSDRIDKDLVEIVETMGEKAGGYGSELKVIEIPDGIDWDILTIGIAKEIILEVGHFWN